MLLPPPYYAPPPDVQQQQQLQQQPKQEPASFNLPKQEGHMGPPPPRSNGASVMGPPPPKRPQNSAGTGRLLLYASIDTFSVLSCRADSLSLSTVCTHALRCRDDP